MNHHISLKTVCAFFFGAVIFGSRFVFSFTEPTQPPPQGNVSFSLGGTDTLQMVTDRGNTTSRIINASGFQFPDATVFNNIKYVNFDEDVYTDKTDFGRGWTWFQNSPYPDCDNSFEAQYTCAPSETRKCKDQSCLTVCDPNVGCYCSTATPFREVSCTAAKIPYFVGAPPANAYRVFSFQDTIANDTRWEVWGNSPSNIRYISGERPAEVLNFENGGIPTGPVGGKEPNFVQIGVGGCFNVDQMPSAANNYRFRINALCTDAGNYTGGGELWVVP